MQFKVLSRLRHPNVVRFYGTAFDEIENIFYIVTEFCSGGTLADYSKRGNFSFTPARFGELMKQVFNAVEYMHDVGLVHLGAYLKLLHNFFCFPSYNCGS